MSWDKDGEFLGVEDFGPQDSMNLGYPEEDDDEPAHDARKIPFHSIKARFGIMMNTINKQAETIAMLTEVVRKKDCDDCCFSEMNALLRSINRKLRDGEDIVRKPGLRIMSAKEASDSCMSICSSEEAAAKVRAMNVAADLRGIGNAVVH